MYVLLSGFLPFYGENEKEVFGKIKKGELSFDQKEFEVISESAKDLIRKLLTVDKQKRYTCAEALKHEWFIKMDPANQAESNIDPNVIKSLKEYSGVSYLKKEAMNILVKTLKEQEILHLKKQFE